MVRCAQKRSFRSTPLLAGMLASLVLGGCATSNPREKASGSVLSAASAVHSSFDMNVSLMLSTDSSDCGVNQCDSVAYFDQRVEAIGQRLSAATFAHYPELSQRFEKFEFVVAEKADSGTKSSGAGSIVVLRGVERLGLDDPSLAFVMAREMGHVVAGHHEDNMLSSIAISVVAQLLLPALNIARGAAAIVSSSSAATTMLTSAASVVGSKAMRANLRPGQLRQAEELGMEILVLSGYDAKAVVDGLHARVSDFPLEDDWVLELRGSVSRVAKMTSGPYEEGIGNDAGIAVQSNSRAEPAIGPVQVAAIPRQLIASMNDSETYVGTSSVVRANFISGSIPAKGTVGVIGSDTSGRELGHRQHPQSAMPDQTVKGIPSLY
jgi:Peptidase family M48